MGAWDELDTEISVDVDTSELESLLDLDDIFQPVKEKAEILIKNIHDGAKEGVEDIARRNRSFQEQYIINTTKYPSGKLASSIKAEETNGGYGFVVGTILNDVYPMTKEYGADIYPVNKSVLRFLAPPDWDGETDEYGFVYLKEAHPKPRPYVQPAYEDTLKIAEDLMLRKIETAKKRGL